MRLLTAAWVGFTIQVALSSTGPAVTPGLDVLREQKGRFLEGKRIGLLTNQTGRAIDGTRGATILRDELRLQLVALFSPEHGLEGEAAAGEEIASATDETTGLPVFSLYGENRAPTEKMLAGIDAIVFDVQDVGTRFFTYVTTMKLAMESAASAGIDFVVLDRPNPLGGVRMEGPVLDPHFASFVGAAPIPVVHGMTVGELARLFKMMNPQAASLDLTVVPMRGWRREMLWDDTGLSWRAPSPNLRTFSAALVYPAMGLFEGVNVSEGRGTEETFEKVGAPWIVGARLRDRLARLELPGVSFRDTSFVPRSVPEAPHPSYQDQLCHGVGIRIFDPRRFDSVRTGLEAIAAVRALFPDSFGWVSSEGRYWIDLLLGTDRPRHGIDAGRPVDEILEGERDELERFRRLRETQLLY